jgi:hypothetical protein
LLVGSLVSLLINIQQYFNLFESSLMKGNVNDEKPFLTE